MREFARRVVVLVTAATMAIASTLPSVGTAAEAAAVVPAPAVPLCGVADLSSVAAPTAPPPANPVHKGPGGFNVSFLTVANDQLVAVDSPARTIHRFSLDGQRLGALPLPFQLSTPGVVVDPAGNTYVARYPDTLVKLDAQGVQLWARPGVVVHQIDGLFGLGTGSGFRIGVVGRAEQDSALFEPGGAPAGRSAVTGTMFTPLSDGGVLATDGAYVRRYDAGGRRTLVFGDAKVANDPSPTGGPFHFYQQGGAALGPDGTIYVADATRGIEAAGPTGFYRGVVPDAILGSLTERSSLALVGDRLYFAAGGRFNANQHIGWIPLAEVAELQAAPRAPKPVLGFGAGVVTGVAGNYFRPDQAPSVRASFDPWWAAVAPGLRLSYSVRDRHQILAGTSVATTTLRLPTTASALSEIPLALPPGRPGVYEVDARLLTDDGKVVGATCMTYTVGAPGHRLDFSSLPPGADYGGAAPARSVALADVLGTGNYRAGVDWSVLLPDPSGPMHFETYDRSWGDAAREAAARGVDFHVQVAAGTAFEKSMVADGTWGSRVQQLVTHFKNTVKIWEAWNEPNITFGPPDTYVAKVLKPFTAAVRVADPSARVVGGSVVGLDVGYYDAIGKAGGYSLMDIVAIHPYTGHNRSWEEQGTVSAIQNLKRVLNAHSAANKPIWITESAWWADGPGNYLAQADKAARALVWTKVLGIPRWHYFMMEAGYGDYGFSYSLIETGAQPFDYVKPGALALMTAAGALKDRPFTGLAATGLPHAHAAGFGARPGGGDTLLAAWTDDLPLSATLSADAPATVTVTDVLGDTTTIDLAPGRQDRIELSGSPLYLTAAVGANLRLSAAESFGANLAAASAGATATASSATVENPAAAAIDGYSDALDRGDLVGLPAWASAPGDTTPTLTVALAKAAVLNRLVVTTHSIGSIVPGLRTYEVTTRDADGVWTAAGSVKDQFFQRRQLISFSPRTVTAVRLRVTNVDYGGLAGGIKPWFWIADPAAQSHAPSPWYGPSVIYELEAFAGAAPPAPPVSTTTTTAAPPSTTMPPPPIPALPRAAIPLPSPATLPPSQSGYWMVGAEGAVYSFGDAVHHGAAPLGATSAVDIEPTVTGAGYWVVDAAGGVYAFGDAAHLGNAPRMADGESVTSISAVPGGTGYWLFTTGGRVLPFGNAPWLGDMSRVALNGPVLDSVPTPSGQGYYMVAADGGIFTFGDAAFRGSMGGIGLNAPVQSLVPDRDGAGYWLVAADGGIFTFEAEFHGSMGGARLSKPITGMVGFRSGYLMVAEDGGIFTFGDARFAGSLGSNPPARPVAAVAALA